MHFIPVPKPPMNIYDIPRYTCILYIFELNFQCIHTYTHGVGLFSAGLVIGF